MMCALAFVCCADFVFSMVFFSLFVHVCVCAHVRVCACACVCMCVCACVCLCACLVPCCRYGQPVDWWSMGIILYECIHGEPPFTGDTVQEIFHKTVHEPVTVRTRVPCRPAPPLALLCCVAVDFLAMTSVLRVLTLSLSVVVCRLPL